SDIGRVNIHRNEKLHVKPNERAHHSPDEGHGRQHVPTRQNFFEFLDRIGRVSFDAAVSSLARRARCGNQTGGIVEFGGDSVLRPVGHCTVPPSGFEKGSSSRTSYIEIMGSTRISRKTTVRNR